MKFDNIFVFTDFDLDGTVSLLELHWHLGAKPGQLQYKSTTVSNFRREYLSWLNDHKPTDYKTIYILDLDVSNSADLVDKENFIIIITTLLMLEPLSNINTLKFLLLKLLVVQNLFTKR